MVEQEKYPHTLQKKAIGEATSKVIREMAGWMRPGLTFKMQHQLLSDLLGKGVIFQQISCGNNVKVEGLDKTLDDLAG